MAKNNEKKVNQLKDAPMPPLPFAHQIKSGMETVKKEEHPLTIDDALKMIEKMQEFQDKIHKQLEEVYQLTGWTPQYLKTFFNNANNFSLEEWEFVNRERKKMGVKEKKGTADSTVKKTRKKNIGNRRNWLPMR